MTDTDASQHASFAHVTPVKLLLTVFFVLVFLTFLTVAIAEFIPLGRFEVVVSLIIAAVKGTLVCLFFMHMIHDKPYNIIIFVSAFVFLVLFVGFLVMDSDQYQPEIRAYDRPAAVAPAE